MTALRLLLLVALIIPAAASAQDPRGAIRAACKADVAAQCGAVFSRSKALACLVSNAGKTVLRLLGGAEGRLLQCESP